MYKPSQLLAAMPNVTQPKLVTSGVGLWLVWDGQLSSVVGQIFTEFGGFPMVQEGAQAIWYFFGEEAFRALGRLMGFARVNKLPLFVQTFPASLLIGFKYEVSLSVSAEYADQEAGASQELEVLVHPQFKPMLEAVHGLSLKPMGQVSGLARVDFALMQVDANYPLETPLAWYMVLRPLGDPLDKNTAEGWRAIFIEMQALIERMALKYLSNDGYLIFALDNLRSFRNICREILSLQVQIKAPDSGKKYWPCVMAAVPKKGFAFNKELPKRINLDWSHLSPDYPHMSFRSALYLGKGFRISDVRQASSVQTVDDWCQISLEADEEEGTIRGQVSMNLPPNLLAGKEAPCFYCGLTNHQARDCPTKALANLDPEAWEQVAMLDLEKIQEGFDQINLKMGDQGAATLPGLLASQDLAGLMFRAVMEINFPSQLRTLEITWRSTGKDLPSGFSTLEQPSGDYPGQALACLRQGDWSKTETELDLIVTNFGRGLRPRSLQGFWAMEQQDWTRAAYFWQEASRNALTPMQRGYLAFLEARAWEVQGEFQKAMEFYRQSRADCPRWAEPLYRRGVCMVKMGFTDQGMYEFQELIRTDPLVFNRVLLDPELDRGRMLILSELWKPWTEALEGKEAKAPSLSTLPESIKGWFREDHPFLPLALKRADVLVDMAKINNYVCFVRVVQHYAALQIELRQTVDKGIATLNLRLRSVHEELSKIHHEAAWFPFGKLLREFNSDFNSCANKLNWLRNNSMHIAANFRKSWDYLEEMEATIVLLKTRLITLRIVRDATLFVLLLGKSFMWLEIIGLVLSLAAVPVVIFIFQKTGAVWLADLLSAQKWQVHKGLIIIMSILAISLAALQTALGFEKKRAKLFKEEEAKDKAASARKGKPAPHSGRTAQAVAKSPAKAK